MLTAEQMAEVQQQRRRAVEVSAIIDAAGSRATNRLYHQRKSDFIVDFLRFGRFDEYPNIDADRVADNQFNIEDHFGCSLDWGLTAALTPVLEGVPVSASVLAGEILESELGASLGTLRDLSARDVSTPLLLAHVASLGYPLGRRVTMQVAVRATMVLLNRARFLC